MDNGGARRSYKYHASALVFNERNLHRIWDIAYDGMSAA